MLSTDVLDSHLSSNLQPHHTLTQPQLHTVYYTTHTTNRAASQRDFCTCTQSGPVNQWSWVWSKLGVYPFAPKATVWYFSWYWHYGSGYVFKTELSRLSTRMYVLLLHLFLFCYQSCPGHDTVSEFFYLIMMTVSSSFRIGSSLRDICFKLKVK